MSKKGQITDKQEAFCREYVIDNNGTQAAIRAGYSENGAEVRGSELLRNSKVRDRIKELRAEQAELSTLTKQDLLDRLAELTKADKDSDSIRATEIYMKHLGMLVDQSKVEHSGEGFTLRIEPRE